LSLTARTESARAEADDGSGPRRPPWWRSGRVEYLLLAVLALAPQLWSQPGVADSDTKSYLYLDPGRFLSQSAVMWDPTVGLGTVTHEQIGFLWPLGPWFWAVHALGIPLWVGQRLWIGLVLFGAAAGIVYLCRTFGLSGPGRFVAAVAYMLSPYWLQDVGRMGVLILPWAGLGWMIAFVVRAVRQGGWRYPALFALVWLTVSGNNASGPAYAVVAPLLWVLYAVLVAKEHTWRQSWSALWRTGVLTAGVSLWWAWALAIESKYGLNVLGVTEKVSAVAKTSLASEILRGLGYWFYYGADVAGPWAATSADYTQHLWLIVVSFAVPVAALAAAAVVRWRLRSFLVALVVVGMILAVGSHPYAAPSTVGGFIKSFMTKTTAGLALRSSDRATPMVILALAMLLGAGVSALARRRSGLGWVATGLAVVLVGAANPSAFDGASVLNRYLLPTPVPRYVQQAATTLNHERTTTRVLAIPSDNFGAYRYGNTNDPIWPGLLTRSFVTGQQLPIGSIPGYDLLYGLDAPMENRVTDPEAIAPVARLMSAGDVLLQNDIQYELYDRQPPQQLWSALQPTPSGLGRPTGFGTPVPNVAQIPMVDETTLGAAPDVSWPAPLEDYPVAHPRPVARAESSAGALVVAGDGVGLDDVADVGLLDTTSPVLYAGTLDDHPAALRSALAGGATLVVTDTNRKESFLWNVENDNAGITLGPDIAQPSVTLDIFPKHDTSAQSRAHLTGVASVAGSPGADPGDTPDLAIDGITSSAWETRQGSNPLGKWWQVTLDKQVTTNQITILQPPPGDYSRAQWITKATLTFDGGQTRTVSLGAASRRPGGQVVRFPTQSFTTLRITVDRTNRTGSHLPLSWDSPVGLAEVGVGGVHAQSVVAMPTDLLAKAGSAGTSHPLVLVMTRLREAPVAPGTDTEPVLARTFTLPSARTFTVTGTARLSDTAPDPTLDAALGRPTTGPGAVVASSSSRLPGDVDATASAALDGDPATMWSSAMGAANVNGAWLQVDRPASGTVDGLNLVVAADGYHSVPTNLRVQACDHLAADGRCPADAPASSVALPALADGPRQGSTVAVPVHFPAVTGKDLTVTVTGARLELTKDWGSQTPIALPLGIAELGIPGTRVAPAPPTVPGACRSDLLSVDGAPVWVRVSGSSSAALGGSGLSVTACGPDAQGLHLGSGSHVVLATPGEDTGLNLDQLVLHSAPGGGPGATVAVGAQLTAGTPGVAPPSPGPAPALRVLSSSTTKMQLRITGATRPFWLVLGQSVNTGWRATVAGTGHTLGTSLLIDGYANGWLVHPTGARTMDVTLQWTPQFNEDVVLLVSGLVALLCVVLAVRPRRRRGAGDDDDSAPPAAAGVAPAPAAGMFDGLDLPVLVSPFAAAPALPLWQAGIIGAVCGLVAALLVPQSVFALVFVGITLGAGAALAVPRLRGLLGLGMVGFAVAAMLYVLVVQATQHVVSAGWTNHFETANVLAWTAIVLLLADAGVELVRRRRRGP